MLSLTAKPAATVVAQLGESPLWDSNVGLRWLDITGRRLFTLGLDGHESCVSLPRTATAIEPGPGRDLLAVTNTGFGFLSVDNGRIDEMIDVLDDESVTMNDGAVDPFGRCWAGSAAHDGSWRGCLYRLEGSRVSAQVQKLGMSNGIDWSPAGDWLYHVDSTAGTVSAWEYDLSTGTLGERRVLRSVPARIGLPDGLTVDSEGQIWVAVWGAGQAWRLNARTGDTTGVVTVPTPYTTSCAIGGPTMCTLYITTARYRDSRNSGLLYAVDLPTNGRDPFRFAGF